MSTKHHTAYWQRQRRRAKDRDGWRCRRCGAAGRLEVHHLDPDGGDELENLVTLCRTCHIAEHDAATEAVRKWRALVAELLPSAQTFRHDEA